MKRIMIKITAFLVLGLFYCNFLYSQDIIVTNSNEKIKCSIKEISTDEIKYKTADSDIILGITKDQVMEVIFASGETMKIENAMDDISNYADQKKNVVKFRLFSPLSGYSSFSYERCLKPGKSIELTVGIIGLGLHVLRDANVGTTFRVGYKLIKSPDFYIKGLRYGHLLKGLYFMPEFAFSSYSNDSGSCVAGAVLLNLGYQWVFNNTLSVDIFWGLGYGLNSNDDFSSHYGFSMGNSDFPIATTAGFRIGVLF